MPYKKCYACGGVSKCAPPNFMMVQKVLPDSNIIKIVSNRNLYSNGIIGHLLWVNYCLSQSQSLSFINSNVIKRGLHQNFHFDSTPFRASGKLVKFLGAGTGC